MIIIKISGGLGLLCGFGAATVVQKRNKHNHLKDFESEIPMYLHAKKTAEIAVRLSSTESSVEKNMLNIYAALKTRNIVHEKEMGLLQAWIRDIQKCRRSHA